MPLSSVPLGRDCVLYIGDQLLDLENGTPVNPADVTWSEYSNVTDLEVGIDDETIDVTTRANAKRGWAQEIGILKTASITFASHWDTGNSQFTSLRDAALSTTGLAEVSIWAATGATAGLTTGQKVEGIATNVQVSFTQPQPIKGILMANFTLRASSDTSWYEFTAS